MQGGVDDDRRCTCEDQREDEPPANRPRTARFVVDQLRRHEATRVRRKLLWIGYLDLQTLHRHRRTSCSPLRSVVRSKRYRLTSRSAHRPHPRVRIITMCFRARCTKTPRNFVGSPLSGCLARPRPQVHPPRRTQHARRIRWFVRLSRPCEARSGPASRAP